MNTQYAPRPATERQVETLKSMLIELAQFDVDIARTMWLGLGAIQTDGKLDVTMVSDVISKVSARLREHRQAARDAQKPTLTVVRPTFDVPSGRYAVDTEDGHLGFYEVWENGKGYYRVSVLASDETHPLNWRTAQVILRKIEDAGILKAGARYGQEIGICGKCFRTLTDETSRQRGYGPICWGKIS